MIKIITKCFVNFFFSLILCAIPLCTISYSRFYCWVSVAYIIWATRATEAMMSTMIARTFVDETWILITILTAVLLQNFSQKSNSKAVYHLVLSYGGVLFGSCSFFFAVERKNSSLCFHLFHLDVVVGLFFFAQKVQPNLFLSFYIARYTDIFWIVWNSIFLIRFSTLFNARVHNERCSTHPWALAFTNTLRCLL